MSFVSKSHNFIQLDLTGVGNRVVEDRIVPLVCHELSIGARGRNRTGTELPPRDFKSSPFNTPQ